MKKTGIIVLIVILSLIVISLIQLLVIGIGSGRGIFMHFGKIERIKENIVKEEKIDLAGIQDLDIALKASDVNLILTEEQELRVIQYGDSSDIQPFEVRSNSSQVEVKEPKIGFRLFYYGQYVYDVYLPKEYSENLKFSSVSGDIFIEDDLKMKTLEISTTSGDINQKKMLKADSIKISSVSGEVSLDDLQAEKIEIKTTSGEIEVQNIQTGEKTAEITMQSVSGDVSIENLEGKVDVKTTSGEITIQNAKVLGDSNFKSTSGNLSIKIDSTSNTILKAKTTSGRITYPNDKNTTGVEPYYMVNAQTTSGNIRF